MLVILIGVRYVIHVKTKKDEYVTESVTEDEDEDENLISKHFIKMFRDVAPWPGISQASYKPKTENVNS